MNQLPTALPTASDRRTPTNPTATGGARYDTASSISVVGCAVRRWGTPPSDLRVPSEWKWSYRRSRSTPPAQNGKSAALAQALVDLGAVDVTVYDWILVEVAGGDDCVFYLNEAVFAFELCRAGWMIEHLYGGFGLCPYSESSRKQLWFATRDT